MSTLSGPLKGPREYEYGNRYSITRVLLSCVLLSSFKKKEVPSTSRRTRRPTHDTTGESTAGTGGHDQPDVCQKKSESEPQASRAPHEPGPGTRSKVHERPRRPTRRPADGRKPVHVVAQPPSSQTIEKQHTRPDDQKGGPCGRPIEQEPGARTQRPAAVARRLKTSTRTKWSKKRGPLWPRRTSKDREHEPPTSSVARRLAKRHKR